MLHTVHEYVQYTFWLIHKHDVLFCLLKKNQNAPRLSEYSQVRGGGDVKTFRWDGIKGCKYKTFFKKNLNASKPSEHPPQVEECLKV